LEASEDNMKGSGRTGDEGTPFTTRVKRTHPFLGGLRFPSLVPPGAFDPA